MHHSKYSYVRTIVESNMPVLLVGEAGSGKSTLCMQIAEDLSLPFHSISCTKQMSVSALLGFISINGAYISTQLRYAYENGGVFLLDEIDAADPNVLLTLNTIENGFISFPDKIVHAHPDFRLCATANPFDSHSTYTGRSKLDFSTIDRYFVITLERDDALEISLTSPELFSQVSIARDIMIANGITKSITMRDSIRMHKLHSLSITDCVFKDIAFKDHPALHAEYISRIDTIKQETAKASRTQTDATSIDELWDIVQRESVTHTEEKYNSDMQSERIEAFEIAQRHILHNIPLPNGWSITRGYSADNPYDDAYLIKGTKFTHKFSSSEFTLV